MANYGSFEGDDQDGEKEYKLEDLAKISPLPDNQNEDNPMRTVDIPSSEVMIVDDEPHDISITYSPNHLEGHSKFIMMITLPHLKKILKKMLILKKLISLLFHQILFRRIVLQQIQIKKIHLNLSPDVLE